MASTRVWAALVAISVAGCECNDQIVIRNDAGSGGRAGGAGGSAGGGGQAGGGGAGGGQAGSGGLTGVDAGDGTIIGGVDPGTFRLDGGDVGEGSGVGVLPGPDGGLSLNQSRTELYFMWIANASRGWVSKYDTRNAKEVGRYYSVIPKDCANSAGPPCTGGAVHNIQYNDSNSPSRTAIDLFGDMWVANRAPTPQLPDGGPGTLQYGSVTKIANDLADCIDRNGNGRIDTSRDLNNDGEISMAADAGEMIIPSDPANPNTYDECVLFTTPLGGATPAGNVAGRALAIAQGLEGSAGDVWIGVYHEQAVYKLNARNGQPQVAAPDGGLKVLLPFGAYGALVDRQQRLWLIQPGAAVLAQVNTATGQLVTAPDGGRTFSPPPGLSSCRSYGFAVDHRSRIWMPNFGVPGIDVCRFDPTTNRWDAFEVSTLRGQDGGLWGYGRGMAVSAPVPGHPDGLAYLSMYLGANDAGEAATTRAGLLRLDGTTGQVVPYPSGQFVDATSPTTSTSIGVGLDYDGQPWINNSSGNAMKVDNTTGALTFTKQQPAGLYTYSDFTGYTARVFTAPLGTFRRTFEGCSDMTEWRSLTFRATKPPNTTVQAYLRVANTLADLNSAQRFGPFTSSPVDLVALGLSKTRYLRVEFELRSQDGLTSPVLHEFQVRWACPVTIN